MGPIMGVPAAATIGAVPRPAPTSSSASATSPAAVRQARLDALRGLAMLWMAVYHFCFDLNHFGHIRQDFYADPLWTWQRTAIVSLFLLCAGAGQALAVAQGQGWPRFWRRWAQVAACAALVSIGSWWMFPRSWISFGVLHGMALMLIITRCALLAGWLRGFGRPVGLGLALIAAAPLASAWLREQGSAALVAAFNSRWLNPLGVVTHKPITEDWVPLLPWLGVMWLGVGAAQLLTTRAPRLLSGPPGGGTAPVRALAVLGRWSLSFYMLHQPVLIGGLLLWGWV